MNLSFTSLAQQILVLGLLFLTACASDIGMVHVTEEIIVNEEVINQFVGDLGYEFGTTYDQAVDIMFFIDESCSMIDDREAVNTYMPEIYDTLTGPDFINLKWRIGMSGADSQGALVWVDYDDPLAYSKMLTFTSFLREVYHASEAGLDSAVHSIAWDSEFHRPEADFLAIYISDEPDQSLVSVSAYEDLMSQVKKDPFIVTESSVVYTGEKTWNNDDCNDSPDNEEIGGAYIDVSEVVINICDSDWTRVLDVAREHVPTLNERWPLNSGIPYSNIKLDIEAEDSIQVWFNSDETDDWYYDSSDNSVVLMNLPASGTAVAIVYLIEPA
jgi:hypothetical protein